MNWPVSRNETRATGEYVAIRTDRSTCVVKRTGKKIQEKDLTLPEIIWVRSPPACQAAEINRSAEP
jgi:hypothetical protein